MATQKLAVKIKCGQTRINKNACKINQTYINFGQVLVRVKKTDLYGHAKKILDNITPANCIIQIVKE